MNEKNLNILLSTAMLILVASAFLPLTGFYSPWLKYVFTFGAFLAVVARVLQRFAARKAKKKDSLRIRRLHNIEFWSSLCYLVSAYFMIAFPYRSDWLGFLMAGAVLQIYTSLMIGRQLKKEQKANTSGK